MDLLINWAWQGCAVAAAAWAIVRLGRFSATSRYHVWWATLLLVLVLPAVPGLLALVDAPLAAGGGIDIPAAEVPVPRPARWAGLLALVVWGVGASISLLRAVRAHRALRRVRAAARPFPASRERELPHWMRLRGTGLNARLVISDHVRAAAVLGLRSPVIAVSSEAAEILTDEELDRVLVHEWAHVQRRDALGRLAQVLLRGLAWIHPAVRAIDRQLDIEREVACDDWVINVTGGARDLARCLTSLAAIPYSAARQPLAAGALGASSLSIRVRRLLDPRRRTATQASIRTVAAPVATLACIVLSIACVQIVGVTLPTTLPVPYHVAKPGSSPIHDGGVASPALDAALVASTTPAARTIPEREAEPAATSPGSSPRTSPPRRDARAVPVRVTVEPLDSLAPAHRTMWSGPPLPAADRSSAPATPQDTSSAAAGAVKDTAAGTGDRDALQDTPWGAATDAGTSIGRSSQRAATATAGFFTRFGRRIAEASESPAKVKPQ